MQAGCAVSSCGITPAWLRVFRVKKSHRKAICAGEEERNDAHIFGDLAHPRAAKVVAGNRQGAHRNAQGGNWLSFGKQRRECRSCRHRDPASPYDANRRRHDSGEADVRSAVGIRGVNNAQHRRGSGCGRFVGGIALRISRNFADSRTVPLCSDKYYQVERLQIFMGQSRLPIRPSSAMICRLLTSLRRLRDSLAKARTGEHRRGARGPPPIAEPAHDGSGP